MIHWKLEGRGEKGSRTHGSKTKTLVPVALCSAHFWLHPQHLHLQLLTVKHAAALPGRRLVRVDCHVPRHHPSASGQPQLSEVFVLVTPQVSYQVRLPLLGSSEMLQSSSQLSSIITIFIIVSISLFSSKKSYVFLFMWLTPQLTSTVLHICTVAQLLKPLRSGWFISPVGHLPVPFSRNL